MILLGAAQRTTWPNERAVVFRSACYGLNGVLNVAGNFADIFGDDECPTGPNVDPAATLNTLCNIARKIGIIILRTSQLVLTVVRRKILHIFFCCTLKLTLSSTTNNM